MCEKCRRRPPVVEDFRKTYFVWSVCRECGWGKENRRGRAYCHCRACRGKSRFTECEYKYIARVKKVKRSALLPETVRAHKTRDREGALYTRCTELFYAGLLHDFHIIEDDSWRVQYDDGTEPVEWSSDVLRKELVDHYGGAALGTGFFVYGRRRYWQRATP
jgi:hypothetical protein